MDSKTDRTHHEMGPSKLNALAHCVRYRSSPIERDEIARGTTLHEAILGGMVPEYLIQADKEAVWWAREVIAEIAGNDEIKYEAPLVLHNPDDPFGDPITFGTCDAVIMRENGPHIIEVKTGQERDYTPQCIIYALMAMEEYGAETASWTVVYTDKRICDTGSIGLNEAWGYQDKLFARIASNEEPTPNDYCSWCDDHVQCPALTSRALAVSRQWTDLEPFDAERLPKEPAMLAAAYELASRLESWAGEVKRYVKNALRDGAEVPGYELRERRGNRTVADIQMAYMLSMMPADVFMTVCNINVGKFEELWIEHNASRFAVNGKPASAAAMKREFEKQFAEVMGREPSYMVVQKVK